jgi:hypothetical protein
VLSSQEELNEVMFEARLDQIGSPRSDARRVEKGGFVIDDHLSCSSAVVAGNRTENGIIDQ